MPGQETVLAGWLRELGLERYAYAFEDAELTPEILPRHKRSRISVPASLPSILPHS